MVEYMKPKFNSLVNLPIPKDYSKVAADEVTLMVTKKLPYRFYIK